MPERARSRSLHDAVSPAPPVRSCDEVARSLALLCRELFAEPSEHLRLGRYEIVRTLGRGSMGVVYEAIDSACDERVALKLVRGRGPSDLHRLEREFRTLTELRHPSLVAVRELVVERDFAYFSMEVVDGCDIVAYVREGFAPGAPLVDRARLCAAFAQLAGALRALHAAGKVHRDIKPANVRVTSEGRVILLDLGLVEEAFQLSDGEGTPAYMAPERFAGVACPRSDWYAFGCVLGEALWGHGAAHGSWRPRRAHDPLERLAERLLDRDPARRPSAADIGDALGGAAEP
jgi:eukaryotic-like serine/threonine-protein kinase